MSRLLPPRGMRRRRGAVTVEFAVSVGIFVLALMAMIEFARLMLVWNTAADATRLAARLAAVCDSSSAQQERIRQKVRLLVEASGQVVLGARTDWIRFEYLPSGCNASTCTMVETRLHDIRARLVIPIVPVSIALPTYPVRQVRESMGSVVAGDVNTACS